jgi:hypothetical protein
MFLNVIIFIFKIYSIFVYLIKIFDHSFMSKHFTFITFIRKFKRKVLVLVLRHNDTCCTINKTFYADSYLNIMCKRIKIQSFYIHVISIFYILCFFNFHDWCIQIILWFFRIYCFIIINIHYLGNVKDKELLKN